MSQPPWGYELLVLVTVGHAPFLVFWTISCHFLSFVLPGLVVFCFLFFDASVGTFPCTFLGCFLADVSHFHSCVLSIFSDILRGISLQTQTRPLLVQRILFYVRYCTCSLPPPPASFGPLELVIFENKTRGSRAWPALGDHCCHRRGGPRLGTPLVALAGTTWIKNTLDQLSQLMWAKVAVGPIVTVGPRFWDTKVHF
jgi:hypothetical protein